MKAVVSQKGCVYVVDEPMPQIKSDFVLVKTVYSTVSPGTELVSVGRMQENPAQLGYSAAGIAVEVGDNVTGIAPGQPVACYGAPYVKHAGYLLVPKQLAVPVPPQVGLLEASTVGLGGISIHAMRQARLQFGEAIVIVGLGIVGQIMARIAQAACLKVIAIDLLPERRKALEEVSGIEICGSMEEVDDAVKRVTGGLGTDAVMHCAGGHQKELIDHSFEWIRDRGKIVIVGNLYMEFSRMMMFQKEAQVLISRAAGPGRYDKQYEHDGLDYPPGYVRWTEGRNLQEYIRLLAERRFNIDPLITKQVPVAEARGIYEQYQNDPQSIIGAAFMYGD